jgi:hypothetical protein
MGANIAEVLEPGGFFFIADEHPFASIFNDEDDALGLAIQYFRGYRMSSPRSPVLAGSARSSKRLATPIVHVTRSTRRPLPHGISAAKPLFRGGANGRTVQ